MGTPFAEETGDLLKQITKDRADQSGAELIAHNYERGKDKYTAFMEKLKTEKDCFYNPIKKCNYTDFLTTTAKSNDNGMST